MIFDSNLFKNHFRRWCEDNPFASDEEARNFCQSIVPWEAQKKYQWLIEECLMWFSWVQKNNKETNLFSNELSQNKKIIWDA